MTTIKNVVITKNNSYIHFLSKDFLRIGTVVEVKIGDAELFFEIDEISTEGVVVNDVKKLSIRACQTGFYQSHLNHNKDDIRDLIGCNIEVVTDKEKLKEIYKQSRWC